VILSIERLLAAVGLRVRGGVPKPALTSTAVMILKAHIQSARDPTTPSFRFVMSMGILVGFVIAHPMSWWLAVKPAPPGFSRASRRC
jgi:hypothetical protein